jgi:hypothetical protein
MLSCHFSSVHISNGSTAVPPPVSRSNLTSLGQYLCWDMKVWMIKPLRSIADQILVGSLPTVTVRQQNDENANVALMHIGLIAGTPVCPRFAFSSILLEFFYHLRRRQPSIGIQGFVKASCALQQVHFPCQITPKRLTICIARSDTAIPWSNSFHKRSTSSLTCSADYKGRLMLCLAMMILTGT